MNLQELYEKRGALNDAARRFHEEHRANWTEADQTEWQRRMDEINALSAEIRRIEQLEAIDAENRRSQGREVPPADPATGNPEGRAVSPTSTPEYRDAYLRYIRTGDQSELRSMNIQVDPSGGFMVPDEFHNSIVTALNEYCPMRQYATVLQTSGDRKIVTSDLDGTATWTDEETAYGESDETLGQKAIGGHKLTRIIKVSEELVQDSAFDIWGFISNAFAMSFAKAEELAFTTGNGVARPTGFTIDAQIGKTTTANNAIDPDEIFDLYFSLKAPYRRRGVWMMNDTILCEVAKMKDGAGRYIWQLALAPGMPDTILGKPVIANNSMSELAAGAKVMAFGDFSYYWIADRGTPIAQRLLELYAATGQIGFRMARREDARLVLPEAVKLMVMNT